MTTDQELQEELVFTRFPAEKQELVRGLVSYAMLMGLDGKDLSSIGQKLTRMDLAQTRKANAAKIAVYTRLPVQKNGRVLDNDCNFRLKTSNGYYKFSYVSSTIWEITSMTSKVLRRYKVKNEAQFGAQKYLWQNQSNRCKQLLLDIADGNLVLNF